MREREIVWDVRGGGGEGELTGVGFLREGSIKSIKPGENKGDSTKHVAAGKTSMLKNKHLKDWSCIVSKQMAHLSIPQAIGLATWSFGVVMTKSSSLTQVSQLIADINEEKPNTVRQRLKEWYLGLTH